MFARVGDHLLQRRQLIVEISTLLINERQPAPDIEAIGKFRRRFLKQIGCPPNVPLVLLERNASRLFPCFFIGQREIAFARFLRRDVYLTLIETIIGALDPRLRIVRRLLSLFTEQRLDLRIGMLILQLLVARRVIFAVRATQKREQHRYEKQAFGLINHASL